eukprot:CAMPEP_0201575928 /NCGR_PEP_ID=MMETSP0190_2-20130828/21387_1 /ASSEMBLY_ACC=CAM_ASM_000263 /TAXON_ID=37353 /ORGANISM="Rosalina sp." /LENGTH=73 /DNA_ID=CAMNT_0048006143 /DNA_START=81 /DNA_END=302 /DNA_ORIENTATION=-
MNIISNGVSVAIHLDNAPLIGDGVGTFDSTEVGLAVGTVPGDTLVVAIDEGAEVNAFIVTNDDNAISNEYIVS